MLMMYYSWHVVVFPLLIVEHFNRFHKAWCERYGSEDHSRTEICIYGARIEQFKKKITQ
jgi:hypothetical protein